MSDSWRHRAARRQPQHSRMEQDTLLALHERGIYAETDHVFYTQVTKPDLYLPEKGLAVYLDGEKVHRKRQDKDDRIRELLAKRHGVKVLSVTYRGNSKAEKARVLRLIVEAAK